MKKIVTIIFLTLFTLISYSGIDEMHNRDKGYEPTYQKDKNDDDDKGNGHGHGGGGGHGNPNAPIDSHIIFLASLVLVYGTYMIYTQKKRKG